MYEYNKANCMIPSLPIYVHVCALSYMEMYMYMYMYVHMMHVYVQCCAY